MDDWCTILRSGMWRLNYKLSAEGKRRFFGEFLPLLHDTKTEVMGARDDDSWYLVYIGTKVKGRGKGYARKLIEYVTKTVSRHYALATNFSPTVESMYDLSQAKSTYSSCLTLFHPPIVVFLICHQC